MLIRGDARALPLVDECVDCVVTSPPYWGLRDYGTVKQIGLEMSAAQYVRTLVDVFRDVWRVLKRSGTLWLNLGDSYAGGGNYRGLNSENTLTAKQFSNRGARGICQALGALGKDTGPAKPKELCGIPWRVALALQADGWYLRSDVIWSKPNPMPESVTDRPTKSHEYLFLFAKGLSYYYDADAIKEPFADYVEERVRREADRGMTGLLRDKFRLVRRDSGGVNRQAGTWFHLLEAGRNKRSVWTVGTAQYAGAHFACFPEALIEPCILAGCPLGGLVLDPFIGSGTTGVVCERLGRRWVGVDLAYQDLAKERTAQRGLRFESEVSV